MFFKLCRVYERPVLFLSKMVYKRAIGQGTLRRSLPWIKRYVVKSPGCTPRPEHESRQST